MAASKTVFKTLTIAASIAALFSTVPFVQARNLNWTNFTSFKNVRHMALINDTVFVATSGGILAITDFGSEARTFTNLDGLGTNDITSIMQDGSGQKWVTGFGRLIKFSESGSQQYLFFDIDDDLFRLRRVVDDGGWLWIATDLGLVLFSKTENGGQIQDSYQLFDDLNPNPIVYDVLLEGSAIWIATSSGLAAADRAVPSLLKSPLNWTGFGIAGYPELKTDTVIRVVNYESEVYVATRRGAHRLQMDTDTVFLPVGLDDLTLLYDLKVENDSLLVYYRTSAGPRIEAIIDTTASPLVTTGLPSGPLTGVGTGQSRWVAATDGIYNNTPGEYSEYTHTGIPGNNVTDITVNSDAVITAGFGRDALARYFDGSWQEFDALLRSGTTVLMTDTFNNTWMGTSGNGVWFYDGDTLINYDETNSTMRGNIDNPPVGETWIIVLGLVTDGRYLYAACYRALNNYPVAIGDLYNIDDPDGWDSVGIGNGLTDIYVNSLDIHAGRLAVGSEANGVYVCNVGDDPFNTNITCQQYTRQNSLLISNNARVVRFSPAGELWVGTTSGLSRYDSGIDRFVDVDLSAEISSHITSLEFDGRGNAWVGTRKGMAIVDAVTGEVETYTTLNSNIVSDSINSVTFDSLTGDFYIGTSSGFSMVPSATGRPTFDIESVLAIPNPFVIDDEADRVEFNYARGGQVRIFNVAGELVRQTIVDEPWDGRNDRGEEVASGVYIYVITDGDGNVGKGKLLLVRH